MKEAMNHAIDVLKDSQDYKMGRAMTVEAVEALEEAVLNLNQQVVSLQCANCQVTIETLNDKVMSLLAKQEQGTPVAWPCVIETADFEEDTVTLKMQSKDYSVGVGLHWLSTTPQPKQERPQNCGTGYCSCIECVMNKENT